MVSENTPLASSTGYGIGDPSGGAVRVELNPHHDHEGACEAEEEEEEMKVSTLELFSDLVIVVSIHIVASPIEESEADIGWYLIRVFMLWFVWHRSMIFMNAAAVFRQSECILHYLVVFMWMAFVLAMTQAFSMSNDTRAIKLYLVLRALETLAYYKQVTAPRPPFLAEDRYNRMKRLLPSMIISFVAAEVLPLSLAIFLRDRSTDDPSLPAVLAALVLILLTFILGALSHDGLDESGGKTKMIAFNADHLQERYELISLIFIGEICFAAGRPSNDEDRTMASAAALISAFGAYLLVFTTGSAGQTEFWVRSIKHRFFGIIMYVGLFCSIPAIGAGLVRVLEEDDASEVDGETEHSLSCNLSAADLLCYASGAFLIFSSLLNLSNLEATKEISKAKIGIWARVFVRLACGFICLLFSLLGGGMGCAGDIPSPTFLCPLLMLTSAIIEIWAVRSVTVRRSK